MSTFDPKQVYSGMVKRYNPEKGFGFIKATKFQNDIFFHISNVDSSSSANISENNEVTFFVAEGKKGLEAKAVTVSSR